MAIFGATVPGSWGGGGGKGVFSVEQTHTPWPGLGVVRCRCWPELLAKSLHFSEPRFSPLHVRNVHLISQRFHQAKYAVICQLVRLASPSSQSSTCVST